MWQAGTGEEVEPILGQDGMRESEADMEQTSSNALSLLRGTRSFSNGQEASEAAAIFRQVGFTCWKQAHICR